MEQQNLQTFAHVVDQGPSQEWAEYVSAFARAMLELLNKTAADTVEAIDLQAGFTASEAAHAAAIGFEAEIPVETAVACYVDIKALLFGTPFTIFSLSPARRRMLKLHNALHSICYQYMHRHYGGAAGKLRGMFHTELIRRTCA